MKIATYIEREREHLIRLRRWFHAHPEASLQEYKTAEKIEEELDRYGITHRRIKETGVYAQINGEQGSGKVLVLRADTDALSMDDLLDQSYRSVHPGCAHTCGHDAHTAVLLIAAKLLQERKNEFSGEVRFFFQPGEEIGQGARTFIQEGCLKGADRIYGAHMCSALDVGTISLTPGPINASCDYFRIHIQGKGAHVSTPHKGIDALYIASQLVINLQSIVSRSLSPLDTAVVGVGTMRAGTQYNIVAEEALLEGTTRSFSTDTRAYLRQRVCEIAEQSAALYGAVAEVEFQDYAAPLINDRQVVADITPIAESIAGKGYVISNQEKMMQADDFADYLALVPGCYAFIGSRNKRYANSALPHHHAQFDIDEEAMLLSLAVFVQYALHYLA